MVKMQMKAGQKYDTPDKNDSLYKFYTSLHKQNKKSKMAIEWCIKHGVFRADKAERILVELKLEKLTICKKPVKPLPKKAATPLPKKPVNPANPGKPGKPLPKKGKNP